MLAFPTHTALEAQCFSAFAPPISLIAPDNSSHGIIFASPHSGRLYPKGFTRRSRLPLATLRRNEDAYIDQVIAPLSAHGFPTLQALFPRCFVDVNRAPDELLPQWVDNKDGATPRAAAGLGVVPTMISEHLAIYKSSLPQTVVENRLERLYYPYHAALKSCMIRVI